jgi:hypothetical protein
MPYRILVSPILVCILAAWIAPAAAERISTLPAVIGASEIYESDEASGLALGGFDPVSYFMPDGPRPGRAGLETMWGGVAWRFSSEANLAAFTTNPAAFAPRIGGYDAQAASLGRVVDSRPDIYLVRDDRLYLFRTDAARARFMADPAIVLKSEEAWLALKRALVGL